MKMLVQEDEIMILKTMTKGRKTNEEIEQRVRQGRRKQGREREN